MQTYSAKIQFDAANDGVAWDMLNRFMYVYDLKREEGDDNGLVVERGIVLLRGVAITEAEYEQDRAIGDDLDAASNAGFNPNPLPADFPKVNVWASKEDAPPSGGSATSD